MPDATNAILTLGRRAVWDAIRNATALQDGGKSVFKRQFDFDDETPLIQQDAIEDDLSLGDLPALAIWNSDIVMAWNRNTDQEWQNTLLITLWTRDHTLPVAEDWAEKLIVAIHETTPPGTTDATATYVKQASGHHPIGEGNVSFTPVALGGERTIKAVRTAISLRVRHWKSIN